MSTFVPSGKDIDRKWYVVDASGQTLGRLATKAASVLSGKLNPQYVPYIDMGDHVIVINAEKVRLTGLKAESKLYRRYTGFPGRAARGVVRAAVEPQAGGDSGTGHQGHAAQEQDGPADGYQAEGLSRRQASPPGAGAGGFGSEVKQRLSCSFSDSEDSGFGRQHGAGGES